MNPIHILLSCCLFWALISVEVHAQSRELKTGIAAGGGPQDYLSNAGNGFNLSSDNSWHGAGTIHVGSYLNNSFDLVFSGSIGDLGSSRLGSVGISLKYKFANDYLLPEANSLRPYVFVGGAFNNLSDRLKVVKVNDENYMSLNAGLGARFYISRRIHIGYHMGLGFFLADKNELILEREDNEAFMLNALLLGIDL
jgi:hypothetical protein